MKSSLKVASFAVLMALSPATTASASEGPAVTTATDLTLGRIQRSLKVGMSQLDVIDAAGSPNLVTRGKNGRESWVYDRFSTDTKENSFGAGGGGLGSGANLLGVLGVNAGASRKVTSQKNLLVVVTFTPDGTVETFSYRSSKF